MINHITLFTALLLSGVAEYFSIVGLTTIFPSAYWSIVIMGGSLGLSKIVAVSWVYRNWHNAPATIKYYLIIAVCILMLITSMGTFGYLSKAHLDQAVPTGDVASKIALIDEKIKYEKETIDAARRALQQLDQQVDQTIARTSDDKGTERAFQIRRSQQKERSSFMAEISQGQARVTRLNEEKAPIAAELRKIASEVGPIKYIAELIYGDSADSVIDQAVRWVIILIVAVFDPLALALLIAANSQLRKPDPIADVMVRAVQEEEEKKSRVPLWLKRTHELNEKRKAGKIEIDKDKIKIFDNGNDGGTF